MILHSKVRVDQAFFSLLLMAVLLFQCVYIGVSVASTPQSVLTLFSDDFTGYNVGAVPTDWNTLRLNRGSVVVVSDSDVASGRALHVKTNPGTPTDMGVISPAWDPRAADFKIVAIEYDIRHISGYLNSYVVMSSGSFALHWGVSEAGELLYRSSPVAKLKDGWNRIRLVADRERNQFHIYLNDVETPVAGPVPFRTQPDTWEGSFFRFTHFISESEPVEAYYGNVKAWVVE